MTRSTVLVSLPLTIGLVCSLNTFPKQLHIGRETHQTFIATRISIHRVKGSSCMASMHLQAPSAALGSSTSWTVPTIYCQSTYSLSTGS